MKKRQAATQKISAGYRYWCAVSVLAVLFVVIAGRVVGLQVFDHDFLNGQGDARILRVEEVNAYRGMILDRHSEPLAVSTPVVSIWANPRQVSDAAAAAELLAQPLGLSVKALQQRLLVKGNRGFVYLKRQMTPARAEQVMAMSLPGIHSEREFRRYYPSAEVAAHLVGFTNIDDQGQEGLELAYDEWLHGEAGKKRVLKDRNGHIIKDLQELKSEKSGQNLNLSIDLRLQYLAYRELKAAVEKHQAKSGHMVLLDAQTGEVLAMVNQPSYNPNNRATMNHTNLRNRAITDVFEPGSTVKPLTVAAALESGKFTTASEINTAPGYLRVGRHVIRDHRNYGTIDLAALISKSSNVGASKLALAMDAENVLSMFRDAGLGQGTGSGFPGERSGLLPYHSQWHDIETATLSYGYGVSVTTLQLAQAYTAFANGGEVKPVSLLRQDKAAQGRQVMSANTASALLGMLESVVQAGGTGTRASIPFYRVAGKTGTVHKLSAGSYQDDQYLALFAGLAPASNPRVVAVVVIDEPKGAEYYGGEVAAPVFSTVVAGALRLMNVSPDAVTPTERVVLGALQQGRAETPVVKKNQGHRS
jgi:cell division protein FtsI (penicillin-binding protein 3)